jgi:hypothetical protein
MGLSWTAYYFSVGWVCAVLGPKGHTFMGLAMTWKWIRISLKSWIGCPDGSGTKTKSYKKVAQIACVGVSIFWY